MNIPEIPPQKIQTPEISEQIRVVPVEKPRIDPIQVKINEAQYGNVIKGIDIELPPQLMSALNFDKEIGMMVVSITEAETGDVIKTIPSAEMVEFLKKMKQITRESIGKIVDTNV